MYMYRVFNSDILWANAMLPLYLFFHSPHVFSSNEAEIQSYLWKTQAGSEDQVLGAIYLDTTMNTVQYLHC